MREPVAFTKITTDRILQPSEALASSLNFYGKVEMDYIMHSTGLSDEDVIAALQGEIFYNPVTVNGNTKASSLPEMWLTSTRNSHPALMTCPAGKGIGRKSPQGHWRTQRPKQFPMKSWI